jgi:hypothetical protein
MICGLIQVPSDPLVSQFLDHAAVNEVALLEAFATRLEEALLAEPDWGRDFARRFPPQKVSHPSRILPAALEADMRRQLADLVSGRRTAVDDRLWRGHLFYEEHKPWLAALSRLALLAQLRREIQQLLEDGADLPRLVLAYTEHISAGDLTWIELGELAKKVVSLRAEIDQLCKTYQEARTALNRAFAESYAAEYPRLFGSRALPLVVHTLPWAVKPHLDAGEQALVIIMDGLGYHLWQRFRSDLMAGGWQLEDGYALALLPTVTAVSRHAIFSGPIARWLYPDLTEPDDDAPTELRHRIPAGPVRRPRGNGGAAGCQRHHPEALSRATSCRARGLRAGPTGEHATAGLLLESLYILTRFLPLVEPNLNLLELGPRGTGKTYGIRNISPYSFVISGGKATAAQLFLDLRSRSVGVIARKDVVVFDEIAYARFDDTRDDVLGILKDYMASGLFSRGGIEMPSECGILMVGNTDHGTREAEEGEEVEELLADDAVLTD